MNRRPWHFQCHALPTELSTRATACLLTASSLCPFGFSGQDGSHWCWSWQASDLGRSWTCAVVCLAVATFGTIRTLCRCWHCRSRCRIWVPCCAWIGTEPRSMGGLKFASSAEVELRQMTGGRSVMAACRLLPKASLGLSSSLSARRSGPHARRYARAAATSFSICIFRSSGPSNLRSSRNSCRKVTSSSRLYRSPS